MTLSIAAFVDADRAEVQALWRRCFPATGGAAAAQIDRVIVAASAALFVARDDGSFAGAVMAGADGVRGWLHHLAVVPARRRCGVARALVRHGEAWLAIRGIESVRIQIPDDAPEAIEAYRRLGYEPESVASMSRSIEPQTGSLLPSSPAPEPGCLAVVVTHLEMTSPPAGAAPKPPAIKLAVLRVTDCLPAFYRFLYAETGRDWVWYERRALDDTALATELSDPAVDLFVLHVGGQPAGFVELDRRRLPEEVELRYFGLMQRFIGRGLGVWLLDWAIRESWRHVPRRLYVNTCTLDHPKALPLYQMAGFTPFRQETKIVRDPRPLS